MKLYTQAGCPQCRMVHMVLDKKKAEYEEITVTPDNIDEMKAKGIDRTPVLEIEEEVEGQIVTKILKGSDLFNYINGR